MSPHDSRRRAGLRAGALLLCVVSAVQALSARDGEEASGIVSDPTPLTIPWIDRMSNVGGIEIEPKNLIESARRVARSEDKLIGVYGWREACPPCDRMKAEIWNNPEFKLHASEKMVMVALEVTLGGDLGLPDWKFCLKQFPGSDSPPTPFLILMDAYGNILRKYVGYARDFSGEIPEVQPDDVDPPPSANPETPDSTAPLQSVARVSSSDPALFAYLTRSGLRELMRSLPADVGPLYADLRALERPVRNKSKKPVAEAETGKTETEPSEEDSQTPSEHAEALLRVAEQYIRLGLPITGKEFLRRVRKNERFLSARDLDRARTWFAAVSLDLIALAGAPDREVRWEDSVMRRALVRDATELLDGLLESRLNDLRDAHLYLRLMLALENDHRAAAETLITELRRRFRHSPLTFQAELSLQSHDGAADRFHAPSSYAQLVLDDVTRRNTIPWKPEHAELHAFFSRKSAEAPGSLVNRLLEGFLNDAWVENEHLLEADGRHVFTRRVVGLPRHVTVVNVVPLEHDREGEIYVARVDYRDRFSRNLQGRFVVEKNFFIRTAASEIDEYLTTADFLEPGSVKKFKKVLFGRARKPTPEGRRAVFLLGYVSAIFTEEEIHPEFVNEVVAVLTEVLELRVDQHSGKAARKAPEFSRDERLYVDQTLRALMVVDAAAFGAVEPIYSVGEILARAQETFARVEQRMGRASKQTPAERSDRAGLPEEMAEYKARSAEITMSAINYLLDRMLASDPDRYFESILNDPGVADRVRSFALLHLILHHQESPRPLDSHVHDARRQPSKENYLLKNWYSLAGAVIAKLGRETDWPNPRSHNSWFDRIKESPLGVYFAYLHIDRDAAAAGFADRLQQFAEGLRHTVRDGEHPSIYMPPSGRHQALLIEVYEEWKRERQRLSARFEESMVDVLAWTLSADRADAERFYRKWIYWYLSELGVDLERRNANVAVTARLRDGADYETLYADRMRDDPSVLATQLTEENGGDPVLRRFLEVYEDDSSVSRQSRARELVIRDWRLTAALVRRAVSGDSLANKISDVLGDVERRGIDPVVRTQALLALVSDDEELVRLEAIDHSVRFALRLSDASPETADAVRRTMAIIAEHEGEAPAVRQAAARGLEQLGKPVHH